MPYLVDTNILVYRYDPRDPLKQRRATELLRDGLQSSEARIPHQGIVEFVAATTRPLARGGTSLLEMRDALLEAESLMSQFPVLYPTEPMLRLAIRGLATYRLSWFDAQIWACAEYHGLSRLFSEDFPHGALIGTVRIVNPFLPRGHAARPLP